MDIQRSGLSVEMPPLTAGREILDYLWEIGPTKKDGPIEAPDLVAWEHLLGIEWQPYQSRLLIRLSRAYLVESHGAAKRDAVCPWPEFQKRWLWVQNQTAERALDRVEARAERAAKRKTKQA